MKSALRGKSTLVVEVSRLGPNGFWLLLDDRELFLAFKEFPWFQDARIRDILAVERPSPHHLRWPDLDIDLAVESIGSPERFPLVSGPRPDKPLQRSEPPRGRRKRGRACGSAASRR